MPALNGIEEKYLYGYKVDNENEDAIFNDKDHLYINKKDGYKYTSVTTLVKMYEQPYDSDFWSMYKVFERLSDPELWVKYRKAFLEHKKYSDKSFKVLNIDKDLALETQKQILKEWEENKNNSCERGTNIHADREAMLYSMTGKCMTKFGLDENIQAFKGVHKLNETSGVFPEYFISWTSEDGLLKIAGMADIVIKNGNEVIIGDWKTNKEIKTKGYYNSKTKKTQCMLYPLNKIPDVNYYHYSLQMSIYMWLLQQQYPDITCGGLFIWHIDHDGNETKYDCEYLKDDVERLLKHYKKQIKIQSELELNKTKIYGESKGN